MTSTDETTVTPAELGIDPEKLKPLRDRAEREVAEGVLPSAQIAVARHGRLAYFETFGEATNETLYCVFSSTKAFTSAAAWLLMESGDLDVRETVADIVPEFGTNGKETLPSTNFSCTRRDFRTPRSDQRIGTTETDGFLVSLHGDSIQRRGNALNTTQPRRCG
mgnify:CR=1 FL=1